MNAFKIRRSIHFTAAVAAIAALSLTLAVPVAAGSKKFTESDDAKDKDEPAEFLKDYDKLVQGKEADWVYFTEGTDLKAYKSVVTKPFSASSKSSRVKSSAEYGQDYLEQWIKRSKKLGWELVKNGKADLKIESNIVNAWEPTGAARMWGGWAANPGVVMELIAKDSSGKIVFQIRHKAKGSTLADAVENGLENVIKTVEKWK